MQRFYESVPEKIEREVLTEDTLISGLFDYIKKNNAFKQCFAALDQAKLAALLCAINKADFNADIFNDSDATTYVVYLIQTKAITFSLGMSVYIYLLAQGQFNDKPHLKEEDQKKHCMRPLQMYALVDKQTVTPFACDYLETVQAKLADQDLPFDIDKAKAFILDLPLFEQYMLTMPDYRREGVGIFFGRLFTPAANESKYKHRYDYILNVSRDATALFSSKENNMLHIPAYGLINHIFSQMQKIPLQMKPIFGSISINTLTKLHALDQHPVDLYSRNVRDNVKYVHDVKCGALPALIHDFCHCYWGNLYTFAERMFIQQELLPLLRRTAQTVRAQIGNEVADISCGALVSLFNLHENLDDYNLSDALHYSSQQTRLYDTMTSILFNHRAIYGKYRSLLYNTLLPELEALMAKLRNDPQQEHFLKAVERLYEKFNYQREGDRRSLLGMN